MDRTLSAVQCPTLSAFFFPKNTSLWITGDLVQLVRFKRLAMHRGVSAPGPDPKDREVSEE